MFKSMKGTESASGGLGGVFSALEILEPLLMPFQIILEIVGGLFAVMAGEILPPLMEALQPVFDILIDLMPTFKSLGKIIGKLLAAVLPLLVIVFIDIFKALAPLIPILLDLAEKLLPMLIDVIMVIVNVIVSALKPILDWLNSLSAGQLAAVMYALFVGMAFLYGMLHAPPGAGVIVGAAMAAVVAGVMSPMLFEEGGLVTKPTLGIVEAGEGVFSLDEWRDSNQDVIYGLEDNREVLERIEGELIRNRRYERRRVVRR